MKRRCFPLLLLVLAMTSTHLIGQIDYPAPSPQATLTQTVGLTTIAIDYCRPSLKGRKMLGGLLPNGQLWRTGANASTKITFSDDVQIEGNELESGTYALYTIPGEEEWTVIIHKNISLWGDQGYKEEDDAFRFVVKTQKITEKVETFTIDINEIRSQSANVNLIWENTRVSFTVSVDTDSKVLADIKKKMKGISGTTYYQAAKYYYDTDKDKELALEWIEKSIDIEGEKFWLLRLQALILADLGKTKKAIKAANKSKQLAERAGNDNYVKMNEASIQEWKKK